MGSYFGALIGAALICLSLDQFAVKVTRAIDANTQAQHCPKGKP